MATQYSPDGQPLPLALGNFGTTQSTIDPATRTPTMAESNFYDWSSHGQSAPAMPTMQPIYGGPTRPEGWNPGPSLRMGGGGSINLDPTNSVPVKPGAMWQRYSALQANPNIATADPAYQFMFGQGMEALNRTAAARRMRFAGKTMSDAQNFGQGLAAQNLRTILPELRAGAAQEYERGAMEARAKTAALQADMLMSDPYGHAARAANYNNPYAYYASVNPGNVSGYDFDRLAATWQKGQEFKKRRQEIGWI